jgi:hypothetical protein
MKNAPNKEDWVNEVIESAKRIKRADPGEDFYDKLMNRLEHPIVSNIKPQVKDVLPLPSHDFENVAT